MHVDLLCVSEYLLNFVALFVNYCVSKTSVKFKIFILKKNHVILLVLSELYIRS